MKSWAVLVSSLVMSFNVMAAQEYCGLDDRFESPRDFTDSRVLAQNEADWNCRVLGKSKAVRTSGWRDRHSDGADCQRDPIDGSCSGSSMMYAPVNQSCADFSCK